MGEDKVGRIIITYDISGEERLTIGLKNIPPILALGLLTIAHERIKREVLAAGASPAVVPRMKLPRV